MTFGTNIVDCLIIGGGPAGLATALGLSRAVRTVVLFDSKTYRNSLEEHMHNVSTWDNANPRDYLAAARRELTQGPYKTFNFSDAHISRVCKTAAGHFEATDSTGKVWTGRKLVLATGVKDEVPSLKGYADCWPQSIFHCLFCHGFEERESPSAGVLAIGPIANPQKAEHLARLAHNLAETVTIYTDGDSVLAATLEAAVKADRWATVNNTQLNRLERTAEVPVVVHLQDGTAKTEGFLVHAMKTVPILNFEHNLDLELSPQGTEFKTTLPFGETTTGGCFAAGDCGIVAKAVSTSIGQASMVAVGVTSQLAFDQKGK